MPAPNKTQGGPLTQAAAALEDELRRYDETAAELDKIAIASDKALQRARKALEECSAHQEKLAALLPDLARAIQAAQVKQQKCVETTARGTARLKERFEARKALLDRVAALGQRAQEINGSLVAATEAGGQRTSEPPAGSLEEVTSLMEAVIAEAGEVYAAAQEGDWQDIARDTEALKQRLQSARGKIIAAQRNLASGAVN